MHTFIAQLRESLQRLPDDKKVGNNADIKWYREAKEIRATTSKWVLEDAVAKLINVTFRIEEHETLKRALGKDWFEQYEAVRADPEA